MKKILFWFLLFLFPLCVHAADETIFSINEVTASPGNNVKVVLNVKNSQDFGVLTARIHYDKTKVTYVSHDLKGLKNGILRGADNNTEKGFVVLYGITLSTNKLMNDNGKILEIEFLVNDNATGDMPLEIEIVDFGVDENTTLKYKKNDGTIHIKNDVTNVKPSEQKEVTNNFKEELKKNDVKDEDITITSSDEDVATVGEDGNIEFKNDGNVTIEAKDKDGNVVYSKEYLVNNHISKVNKKLLYGIGAGVLLLIVLLILLIRRKNGKKKIRHI